MVSSRRFRKDSRRVSICVSLERGLLAGANEPATSLDAGEAVRLTIVELDADVDGRVVAGTSVCDSLRYSSINSW